MTNFANIMSFLLSPFFGKTTRHIVWSHCDVLSIYSKAVLLLEFIA